MKMWGRRQDSGDVPTFSGESASERVAARGGGGREGGEDHAGGIGAHRGDVPTFLKTEKGGDVD